MRRLILLRHAKAEGRAPSGEDIDRVLTPDGRRAAAEVGRMLALAGLIPAKALVSAAARTRETFQACTEMMPDVELEVRRDLYETSAEALHASAETAGADSVLVVGHNPSVQVLASRLAAACAVIPVGDRELIDRGFPTATAAAFEFSGGRTACLGVFRPQRVER